MCFISWIYLHWFRTASAQLAAIHHRTHCVEYKKANLSALPTSPSQCQPVLKKDSVFSPLITPLSSTIMNKPNGGFKWREADQWGKNSSFFLPTLYGQGVWIYCFNKTAVFLSPSPVFMVPWIMPPNIIPVSQELWGHHLTSPEMYQYNEIWPHKKGRLSIRGLTEHGRAGRSFLLMAIRFIFSHRRLFRNGETGLQSQ